MKHNSFSVPRDQVNRVNGLTQTLTDGFPKLDFVICVIVIKGVSDFHLQ